jgi:hypothetical protein
MHNIHNNNRGGSYTSTIPNYIFCLRGEIKHNNGTCNEGGCRQNGSMLNIDKKIQTRVNNSMFTVHIMLKPH